MFFSTTFEGTLVGIGAWLDFSAGLPVVPRTIPAADTILGPVPKAEATAVEDRPDRWVECQEQGGVVEIHDPRLFRTGREAFSRALAESAIERSRARRVSIDLTSATCRLQFEPGSFDRAELGRCVAEAVSAAIELSRDRAGATHDGQASWTTLTACATPDGTMIRERQADHPACAIQLINDPTATCPPTEDREAASRLVELAKAGGALSMAVAGAILPGIPTLPFLLLTAHHAVRVSPALDRFLRRQPWVAALLDRAAAPGGLMRLDRRTVLKLLPILVLTAVVLLLFHPPMPVVIALEMALMAFIGLREMGLLGAPRVAATAAA
jgi:uncharacterized membrane protein YbaN (DUF454 family)